MKSHAATVADYLGELPDDRRDAVALACERVKALTPDVAETMNHGMPFYERDGDAYIAVASQKHHLSVYVVDLDRTLESHPELAEAFDGVNRGKNCLRYRPSQLDQLNRADLDRLIRATRDR